MNAIKFYRIGRWCYLHKIPLLPMFFKQLTFLLFNSVVPFTAVIGKGSKLAYGGIGVVIHSKAKIGENVSIGQNVTVGSKSKMEPGAPTIKNNVYISTGAKVLGNITVGENVIIGANAVVIRDVEDNCVVAGVPAKVIKQGIDATAYSNFFD